VNLLRRILRLYSFAFHALFALVVLAAAFVMLASKPATISFYLLPWRGPSMLWGLLLLALIGLIILLLAVRGKIQKLYGFWSVVVFILIVRLFFFSPASFTPGRGEFQMALWIILAAVLAVVGACGKPASSQH
jgi:hypothetical protein